MDVTWRQVVLRCVAAVGLAASASLAGAQTTSTAEDEAAIRSVMAKGAEAFNRHDAAAAAAVYAADADLVNVRGDHLKGRWRSSAGWSAPSRRVTGKRGSSGAT